MASGLLVQRHVNKAQGLAAEPVITHQLVLVVSPAAELTLTSKTVTLDHAKVLIKWNITSIVNQYKYSFKM